MSPQMSWTVIYLLLCANMTVWCTNDDDIDDSKTIPYFEATFEKFRDEKSDTDHYRLVYSAIQVFHQCDVEAPSGKFRSLSFVDQIDLVTEAFVKTHLLPAGLTNPVNESAMTEAGFRTKFQAWPAGFLDGPHFKTESIKCKYMLRNFLVNAISIEQQSVDRKGDLLFVLYGDFFAIFMEQVYHRLPSIDYSEFVVKKPEVSVATSRPTLKLPRWQTVATYVIGGTVVASIIAGVVHFWPTDSTDLTTIWANVNNNFNSTQASTSSGGTDGATFANFWTIVIIIVFMMVAIVTAFVVYRLRLGYPTKKKKSNGKKGQLTDAGTSPSSNSFVQSKARTTECKNSSTGST